MEGPLLQNVVDKGQQFSFGKEMYILVMDFKIPEEFFNLYEKKFLII